MDGEGQVRVADFGLSRDLYDGDYYRMKNLAVPLPIRWMSLEAVFEQKFSEKSDVVSQVTGIQYYVTGILYVNATMEKNTMSNTEHAERPPKSKQTNRQTNK